MAKAGKYRSGFEENVAEDLEDRGIPFKYESFKLEYEAPSKKHKYLVDFYLVSDKIILETKGRLTLADRKKMLLVKAQHPDLDIRFIFQRANNKIAKGSKTSYAEWADKHGFLWAQGGVPEEWMEEFDNDDEDGEE